MKKLTSLTEKILSLLLAVVFLINSTSSERLFAFAQEGSLLGEAKAEDVVMNIDGHSTVSNDTPLSGAAFSLYEWDDAVNDWRSEPRAVMESGTDGRVLFPGLTIGGRYRLVETNAPDGYVRPDGYWVIHVSADGGITIEAVGDGQPEFFDRAGILYLPNEPEPKTDDPSEEEPGGNDPPEEEEPGSGDDETEDDFICIEGHTLIVLPKGVNTAEIEIESTPGWTYEFVLMNEGHYIIEIEPPTAGLVPTDEVIVTLPVGVIPDDVVVCLAEVSLVYPENDDSGAGEVRVDTVSPNSGGGVIHSLPQTEAFESNQIAVVIGLLLGIKAALRMLSSELNKS